MPEWFANTHEHCHIVRLGPKPGPFEPRADDLVMLWENGHPIDRDKLTIVVCTDPNCPESQDKIHA